MPLKMKIRCLVFGHTPGEAMVSTLINAGVWFRQCAGICSTCGETVWWREDV